jgi:hypothetical protein
MRVICILSLGLVLSGLLICSCGGDENNGGELDIYAGRFSVVETFKEQSGSMCPPEPGPYENGVDIKIKKNQFEADFDTRWGTMLGQIDEDAGVLAVDNQGRPDEEFQLTGQFVDLNGFSGSMREVWQGCTRWTNLLAERVVQE